MSSSKLLLLFVAFVASVGALSTPHARGIHHRALAGRIAVPESVDVPAVAVRKRQNGKRCKPRSSAALAVSTKEATSTKEPATTKEPSPTKEAPTTKQTQAHTTHEDPPPPSPTHEDPPPPPPTTTHKASPTPKPAPSPTKEAPPPPATTKKPAPAPASDLPSYLTGSHSGDGTFYATGLGACGIVNNDSDFIAAASMHLFDGFLGYSGETPTTIPSVTVGYLRHVNQGKTVEVTITDRCVGCAPFDLDFSPSAFDKLASESIGRLHGVQWKFI